MIAKSKSVSILTITLFVLAISSCYVPNDPPQAKVSFGFPGRVERLQDAFFSMDLDYYEPDFVEQWQSSPHYVFNLKRGDTIINYTTIIEDCQSIYYLVNFEDNWNCDSSYIHIMQYGTSMGNVSTERASEIFFEDVITGIRSKFNKVNKKYHWEIKRYPDSVMVYIFDQNNSLKKRHFFWKDTVSDRFVDKTIFDYRGDSIVIYEKDPKQSYVYYLSKTTVYTDSTHNRK